MATIGKEARRRGRWVKVMGSAVVAILFLGFLVWWNYGWIAWNKRGWERRLEGFALRTFGDAWERQSRDLTGRNAVNCGRVGVYEDPKAATECALKAFRVGKPFRVRYDLLGVDSAVSSGLVYTPEGKLCRLFFDGDPAGGGGISWSRQRVQKLACPVPFQLHVNPSGRLNCLNQYP